MNRRIGAIALLACACNGEGAALAQGLGEALAIAALIGLVLLVVVAVLAALLWVRLVASLRAAVAPGADAGAAVRAWSWTLMATLVHAAAILLTSQWHFGDGPLAAKLLVAAIVPLSLLTGLAVLAARRGRAWPLAPSAVIVVSTAVVGWQSWGLRGLDELPGRVVEVAGINLHACARLSDGRVACEGANWQGQRGDGSEHGADAPTFVRGISDATAIHVADDLSCALRSDHPPTCWGGDPELPAPEPRGLPWPLPGAADATALALAEHAVAWLDRDGALHGWPQPPPDGVTRARRLVGDDDFDGGWFCVLDEADELACWPERPSKARTVRRFASPHATALAVDADAEVACVAAGAEVRCHDLDGGRPPLAVTIDGGVDQLVAVDDDGTFCARAGRRVTCWRRTSTFSFDGPTDVAPYTPAGFADVDAVFAGAGRLCGTTGEHRRCVALGGEDRGHATLLDRDREP